MIDKLPEIQIHSCAKINEKLNEIIDWINDVSALRVTDKQVTANLPNIDAGELAFLSKENTELKDEIDRLETELIRTRKALEFITRISGGGMSYQDMFIDAHEVAKFALGQIKYPVLIGRYDKEMTDLLRGGDNE